MANIQVQEHCNLPPNDPTSDLAPMAIDQEQLLRRTDDPSFKKTFWNSRHTAQEPNVSLNAVLDSDDEGPPSRLPPAPDLSLTLPELPNHSLLRESIR